MFQVFRNSWALLLGMLLLMLGNGLQGTLIGIRGALEGMNPQTISWVMTGYYIGFLGGSRVTPIMIRRVGHVRVYAALASLISAAFILFVAWPNEYFWFVLRIVVGFCFSGVYVVSESWLNDSATNDTRGKTLSLYIIVQMMGIVLAQVILNVADPSGYNLFIIISVIVSLSFAPILLSVSPAPAFSTTKGMRLIDLWKISPLGVVGMFLLGLNFAALFGMSAVYGTERGLSVVEISAFVSAIYLGGMFLQYPIGWFSDRMDRRALIFIVCIIGLCSGSVGWLVSNFYILLFIAFFIGGITNPLYSLYIAYTNDFLEHEDMAAASGGLIFINGMGAVFGPVIVGYMIANLGPESYFLYIAILMALMGSYALYRMTQRPAIAVEDTTSYTPVLPQASPVVVEVAQEVAIDRALEEEKMNEKIEDILDFWFNQIPRAQWYDAPIELDHMIISKYRSLYDQAIQKELQGWENSPNGALALLILLDQFSRNMFRSDANSFAADPLARAIAKRAIAQDFDQNFDGAERQFFFMPFVHSEDMTDQDYGVELFKTRSNAASGDATHAKAHRWVIAQFGRFPYRNAALGRDTTKAEKAFLDKGGYKFAIEQMHNKT